MRETPIKTKVAAVKRVRVRRERERDQNRTLCVMGKNSDKRIQ
jgi:hypothetical protein